MVTVLSGGTGTPKMLDGLPAAFDPETTTVVANTGDDVEVGGLLVCPDLDTVLYQGGGILDRETWWGIDGDSARTHDALGDIVDAAGLDAGEYLPEERQTEGRAIAAWRRFSGAGEFMQIGDRDRAFHITRTSLLDRGHSLTEVTETLADGLGVTLDLLPMSDDPVATIVHTPDGPMHFQEFWVRHGGDPAVSSVEFRGAAHAEPTDDVREALRDPVVVGPSNPVTAIGPMLAMESVPDLLAETPVVAVSPFVGEEAFSGPAADLMEAVGNERGTAGLERAYPFADALVLDEDDPVEPAVHTVRTDLAIDEPEDAGRVVQAVAEALEAVA
jgi:LPPG:FO 2-phospho-L-lactate transferase